MSEPETIVNLSDCDLLINGKKFMYHHETPLFVGLSKQPRARIATGRFETYESSTVEIGGMVLPTHTYTGEKRVYLPSDLPANATGIIVDIEMIAEIEKFGLAFLDKDGNEQDANLTVYGVDGFRPHDQSYYRVSRLFLLK